MLHEGRLEESLALIERAVAIVEAAGVPSASWTALLLRRARASRLTNIGRYDDAIAAFEALRRDAAGDPTIVAACTPRVCVPGGFCIDQARPSGRSRSHAAPGYRNKRKSVRRN